ncbi:hypothetical protein EVAR_47456_1 [Eumeta japonica]|uniref:Uncharacterized protein n=1 Tax=Eumeta variegata TaxID=151549 RepID=A0A4C1XBE6_EUMVA|nr:hypothetical protein EVAR_47456_1 [Eumeta japonica]
MTGEESARIRARPTKGLRTRPPEDFNEATAPYDFITRAAMTNNPAARARAPAPAQSPARSAVAPNDYKQYRKSKELNRKHLIDLQVRAICKHKANSTEGNDRGRGVAGGRRGARVSSMQITLSTRQRNYQEVNLNKDKYRPRGDGANSGRESPR